MKIVSLSYNEQFPDRVFENWPAARLIEGLEVINITPPELDGQLKIEGTNFADILILDLPTLDRDWVAELREVLGDIEYYRDWVECHRLHLPVYHTNTTIPVAEKIEKAVNLSFLKGSAYGL